MRESETGVVELHDEDPDVVDGFLFYLYTGMYPHSLWKKLIGLGRWPDVVKPDRQSFLYWNFDIDIYKLAHKFSPSDLQQLAEKYMLNGPCLRNAEQVIGDKMNGLGRFLSELWHGDHAEALDSIRRDFIYHHREYIGKWIHEPELVQLTNEYPDIARDFIQDIFRKDTMLMDHYRSGSGSGSKIGLYALAMLDKYGCEGKHSQSPTKLKCNVSESLDVGSEEK